MLLGPIRVEFGTVTVPVVIYSCHQHFAGYFHCQAPKHQGTVTSQATECIGKPLLVCSSGDYCQPSLLPCCEKKNWSAMSLQFRISKDCSKVPLPFWLGLLAFRLAGIHTQSLSLGRRCRTRWRWPASVLTIGGGSRTWPGPAGEGLSLPEDNSKRPCSAWCAFSGVSRMQQGQRLYKTSGAAITVASGTEPVPLCRLRKVAVRLETNHVNRRILRLYISQFRSIPDEAWRPAPLAHAWYSDVTTGKARSAGTGLGKSAGPRCPSWWGRP